MTVNFLVTRAIPEPGMSLLRTAGTVTVPEDLLDSSALNDACRSGDYQIVVAHLSDRFDEDILQHARIGGISNYAVGVNNIDIDSATRRSIMVANTPGVLLTEATADVAMLLLLAVARRCVEADQFLRDGRFTGWQPELLLGHGVGGKRLGLAGFGRIARATARRALAFGMEVVFCPRPPNAGDARRTDLGELGGLVTQIDWYELLETSDYVSLHVPLTTSTTHLVDVEALTRMKSTAILINTSRGPVVDEGALVEALRQGWIAGAGLDVFEHEPAVTPGLVDLPNTVLLPHVGSATVPVRNEMARLCALNAIAMGSNETPPHPVNPEAW
ncbi:glyoxylate reductase [Rhodococcus opacus M213]|uniref:Glyoxylate reductase n=1 Tax=Rhodococcus opacus M213 TaxID=1129896 RepID=K8XLE0_RHOOP|nr:D-glycerate dehydrogenase [Rhodococcus opacus]EKT79067.1 glyoxylate reductase [Rhodococcus opacus M213]